MTKLSDLAHEITAKNGSIAEGIAVEALHYQMSPGRSRDNHTSRAYHPLDSGPHEILSLALGLGQAWAEAVVPAPIEGTRLSVHARSGCWKLLPYQRYTMVSQESMNLSGNIAQMKVERDFVYFRIDGIADKFNPAIHRSPSFEEDEVDSAYL